MCLQLSNNSATSWFKTHLTALRKCWIEMVPCTMPWVTKMNEAKYDMLTLLQSLAFLDASVSQMHKLSFTSTKMSRPDWKAHFIKVGFQANWSGSNQTKLQKMKSEINFKSLPCSLTNPSSQQPNKTKHPKPTQNPPSHASPPPDHQAAGVISHLIPNHPPKILSQTNKFPLWKRHTWPKIPFPFF